MKERVRIEYINGLEVSKIDLSDLSGTELIKCCCEVLDHLYQLEGKSYFLVDIRNCKLNIEAFSFLKSAGKNLQGKVAKSAITGVNRHLEPFFKMYLKYTGSKMKSFTTQNDAISYITKNVLSDEQPITLLA